MSQGNHLNAAITRRSWVMLAISTLSGCGGGDTFGSGSGGGGVAGAPGTGGTGIYALGSISGFGSVILNGIKFDDIGATVRLDGVTTGSADLRLGMVASVQGQRGATLTSGVASQIEVWSIAQGLVTQVQAGSFNVAGMVLKINSSTVFDGVSSAAGLLTGLRVAVWGLQAGADARSWTVTRVAVVSAVPAVSTGLVVMTNLQPTLNGLVLTGGLASGLVQGQLVRALGTLYSGSGSLHIDRVDLAGLPGGVARQGELEIEGFVTAVLPTKRFMLGNLEVDASSAEFSSPAIPMTVGLRVEVKGSWQGAIIKATTVENESQHTVNATEIEAKIEQFTSLANFVMRGQVCDATNAVISNGRASDLKVGSQIKVTGTISGSVLVVNLLQIDM